MVTHVFQPLGSGMMRLGQTGQARAGKIDFSHAATRM